MCSVSFERNAAYQKYSYISGVRHSLLVSALPTLNVNNYFKSYSLHRSCRGAVRVAPDSRSDLRSWVRIPVMKHLIRFGKFPHLCSQGWFFVNFSDILFLVFLKLYILQGELGRYEGEGVDKCLSMCLSHFKMDIPKPTLLLIYETCSFLFYQ